MLINLATVSDWPIKGAVLRLCYVTRHDKRNGSNVRRWNRKFSRSIFCASRDSLFCVRKYILRARANTRTCVNMAVVSESLWALFVSSLSLSSPLVVLYWFAWRACVFSSFCVPPVSPEYSYILKNCFYFYLLLLAVCSLKVRHSVACKFMRNFFSLCFLIALTPVDMS